MAPWWMWPLELFVLSAVAGWLVYWVEQLRRENAKLTRAMVKLTTVVMRVNHLNVSDLEKLMGCQALADEVVARRAEHES